jgi:protein gp37
VAETEISWTDTVWNPVRGCRRVSPGCEACYAETMAARLVRMGGFEWSALRGQWGEDPKKKRTLAGRRIALGYKDLVRINKHGKAQWTGAFAFDAEKLREPLSWRARRLVFANSMSDLFGEGLTNEQIAAVFAVMAASTSTFQLLTKRAGRMLKWFRWSLYPSAIRRPASVRFFLGSSPHWPLRADHSNPPMRTRRAAMVSA